MHLFREITNVNAIFQNLTVIEQEEIIAENSQDWLNHLCH